MSTPLLGKVAARGFYPPSGSPIGRTEGFWAATQSVRGLAWRESVSSSGCPSRQTSCQWEKAPLQGLERGQHCRRPPVAAPHVDAEVRRSSVTQPRRCAGRVARTLAGRGRAKAIDAIWAGAKGQRVDRKPGHGPQNSTFPRGQRRLRGQQLQRFQHGQRAKQPAAAGKELLHKVHRR